MYRKIYRNMCFLAIVTLILSSVLVLCACYTSFNNKQKEEIKKLHQEEEIKAYCAHDICSMMEVAKAMKYVNFARHIRRKYEALTDQGFSHDEAMSLIPMWNDADFEIFKEGN